MSNKQGIKAKQAGKCSRCYTAEARTDANGRRRSLCERCHLLTTNINRRRDHRHTIKTVEEARHLMPGRPPRHDPPEAG